MTKADELRARALKIRQAAQYAQGRCYREEMAQAEQLENQARWLDDSVEQQGMEITEATSYEN